MNFDNAEFLKLLENKRVSLDEVCKVLCRGESCTHFNTVHELVLKYEEDNGKIALHQWRKIFKGLGYLEEFSGVLKQGQFYRQHSYPKQGSSNQYDSLGSEERAGEDLSEAGLPLSRPEESGHTDKVTTGTTILGAVARHPGAIPKKRPSYIPDKLTEPADVEECQQLEPTSAECFSADQVSVNGLHVVEGDGCYTDQLNAQAVTAEKRLVGCPSMTPSLTPPKKSVQSEGNYKVHEHGAASASASVSVVQEDEIGQISGKERATVDETSLMENDNFDGCQLLAQALKHEELSVEPSAAPLVGECSPHSEQDVQMAGNNASPEHPTMYTAAGVNESGYFSVQNNETAGTGTSNEVKDQHQQMFTASLNADSCQVQLAPTRTISDSAAVRPATPEVAQPPHHESSLVIGHSNNEASQMSQDTGNPCEQYDVTESTGLVEELQGKIDRLQSNVLFLSKELEERTIARNNLDICNCQLQEELSDYRAKCANLEEQNQELAQRLNQITEIEQGNQEMISMTNQMLQWKQEECNQLEQHIRESETQYNSANADMMVLREELEASKMSLVELRKEAENLHEERDRFILQERERLRKENECILDARLEEVRLAFHNAETDEVKGIKKLLKKEKGRRKKAEERNKQLCEEVERLRTLLQQCSPQAACGAMCSDDINFPTGENENEDESSNASSGELETHDPEESSGSTQQSETPASDESSDEATNSLKMHKKK